MITAGHELRAVIELEPVRRLLGRPVRDDRGLHQPASAVGAEDPVALAKILDRPRRAVRQRDARIAAYAV